MKKLLLFLISFILVFTIYARAEDITKGSINLGSSYQAGLFDMHSFSFGLDLVHKKRSGDIYLSSKFDYMKVNDLHTIDEGSFSFGYDPLLNEHWSLWSLGKVGYDRPNEIDIEVSLGGGIKYILPFGSISYGLLSYEREYKSDIHENEIRHSLRLKANKDIYDLKAKVVLFYQPKIDNVLNDYIFDGCASLVYELNKRLDLAFSVEGKYRSVSESESKGNVLSKISFVWNF